MTKKPGQNGPETPEMRDSLPASTDDSMAGSKNPPLFLTDPMVDGKSMPSEEGHAPAPDVVEDSSILPALTEDLDHDTALPVVHEDRSAPFQELAPGGSEGFEGLNILEDPSVPTAGDPGHSEASAPLVIEDARSQVDDVVETYVNPRPLPSAIDLASLSVDRPKGLFAKLFGRKKPAETPLSRQEPVVVAQSAEASPLPAPDTAQPGEADLAIIGNAIPEMEHRLEEKVQDQPAQDHLAQHAPVLTDVTAKSVIDTVAEPVAEPLGQENAGRSPKHQVKASWFSRSGKGGDRGKSDRKKVRRTPSSGRGNPPIQVIIGWIAESNRKDVIEHARGFAADHIETLASAWISVSPFRDGHIFEVHEGGSGLAYMPDIIEQLTRDPDQVVWVPSGTVLNRVLTIRIAEDHVFSTILTEAESALVRSSGQEPLQRTGRMVRLVPKGTGALATGVALATVGAVTLIGAGYYSSMINQQPLPSRTFNPENLPHSQIIRLSEGIRDDRWVSRIVFEDGQWRADFETVEDIVLPVDDAGAQAVIDNLYNEEERIKKAVEDSIAKETAE